MSNVSSKYGIFPPFLFEYYDTDIKSVFHISKYTIPKSITKEDVPEYLGFSAQGKVLMFSVVGVPNLTTLLNSIEVGDYIIHPIIKSKYQGCNPDGTPGNGTSTIPPYNLLPKYQEIENSPFSKVVSVKQFFHTSPVSSTLFAIHITIDSDFDMSLFSDGGSCYVWDFLFFKDNPSPISSLISPNNLSL